MSALDIRAFMNISTKLVKVEKRTNLLGILITSKIGLKIGLSVWIKVGRYG